MPVPLAGKMGMGLGLIGFIGLTGEECRVLKQQQGSALSVNSCECTFSKISGCLGFRVRVEGIYYVAKKHGRFCDTGFPGPWDAKIPCSTPPPKAP